MRYLLLYAVTLVINPCILLVILVCSVFRYYGPVSLVIRMSNLLLIIKTPIGQDRTKL